MRSLLSALLLCTVALHTTGVAVAASNSSCGCDLTNGTAPFAELGLDVIFVVDVSQAMDSSSLEQASSLINSLVQSLRVDSDFYSRNSSDFNSTMFLTELPWAGFEWSSNSSDYNSTFTREMTEMLYSNLAFAWNNSDNSTFNREMSEMLFANLAFGWNNTDNSTFNREASEMLFSNLAFAWNNSDNSTFNREVSEMLFANLAFGWNNSDNSTFNREMSEMVLTNLALAWNNSDNSTYNREMSEIIFTNLAFAWNNSDNSTFNRELMSQLLFANLAFGWNNTDNSTFTREMFEMFGFQSGNFGGNYSRVGVIAVSETAETLFDLSSPLIKPIVLSKSAAAHANLEKGITSALDMFSRSPRPSRQMIHLISASHSIPVSRRFAKSRLHSPTAAFKRAGGMVAVTDVTSGSASSLLRDLASPGLYSHGFSGDASVELQMLCDANCT